jgi:hypothetical protein
MKKQILFLCVVIAQIPAFAQKESWTNLFDGKTLNGWHTLNGKAKYEVVDGTIVGTTVSREPNSFLATDIEYGDFIFEVELKVGEMNSGIQIRSQSIPEVNNGRVHGLQVEIDPSDRAWSGGIYDEARRGWMYQTEMNPSAKKAFKKGEWNKYRIECIGTVIRTWVNDVPVTYMVDDLNLKGFIALQVHGVKERSGGASIQWKNIRIQTGAQMRPRKLDISTPVANYTLNTLSPQENAQGFKLLFNGKDLTNWRGVMLKTPPTAGWTIENGVLHALAADSSEKGVRSDLVSIQQFKAFELNFDFKMDEGANSGVKYFFTESAANLKEGIGPEFQIMDNAYQAKSKAGLPEDRTMSSLVGLIPAIPLEPRFQKKLSEWNQGKIIVHTDKRVEHWLNGFKVVEYILGSDAYKELTAKSKIATTPDFGLVEKSPVLLQNHGKSVYFRSVKIRELKNGE